LTLANDDILKELDRMESESRALTEECLKMSWFMRGGVSYDDVMALSYNERQAISKIIKNHLETTRESGLPFF
jgi:hypothetical protein